MKFLRITGLVLFLLSAAAYEGYKAYQSNSIDTTGPEIIFENDQTEVSVKATEGELLQGVTAIDEKDGDVTDSLMIEKMSRFTEVGKRKITYAAFDSGSNISKVEREIVYSDYTPPRFSLSEPLRFAVGDTADILKNMTAQDCIDGDITDKIKYETQESYFGQSEGSYHVEIMVTNSAGDSAVLPAEVEFYYPGYQNPALSAEIVLKDYITYMKAGASLDAMSFLKGVTIGHEDYSLSNRQTDNTSAKILSVNDISVTSNVNSKVPGVYDAKYTIKTEDGHTGTTRLIVVVEE